ncbi:unnamed protein product [Closterium sp. NIES-54]
MVPLAESHCLPQAVFPGHPSVNVSPNCQQQRHWEDLYTHEARQHQEQQQQLLQKQQQGQKRPASLLWHGVAKKRCFAWNTEHSSIPPHLTAYWRAADDVAVATAVPTAVNAAVPIAPTAATPATVHWMVFKNASAAGAADDSVGPKDLCSPITLLNRHYQHCHLHHHDKAPVKPRVTEEATLLPTSTTSTSSRTSAASAASNGSASNLNDEECIPWCSDGASQSPSSHCRGSETTAQKAGCATWQPEAAIQDLKHAAVFPFSFGPEAVTGDTAPSMNTHIPFTHVPVSHGCAVVRQPLNHPSSPYNVPSFAGLLNSISPARQLHRRVVPAPATSAVCSSCNHSVSPSLQGKEALLPPEAHAQPQEQEQSDSCAVCSASLSGKTCVLNRSSMGSRCSHHEKQEKQKRQEMRERRVQGLVVTGDVLPGLHDGQWQSAAGSGNGTVSGNPMEGSVDKEDLEELQDTASS